MVDCVFISIRTSADKTKKWLERDVLMKIRAKIFGLFEVTIIDFVPANSNDVKVIYVDDKGKVDSCYLDKVEILDKDYIPTT